MENTLENKQKFFATHYGLKVWRREGVIGEASILDFERLRWEADTGEYLELKPLSSISDEDAVKVAAILLKEESIMDSIIDMTKGVETDKHPFDLDRIERVHYDTDGDKKYYYTDVYTQGKIVSCVRIYHCGDIAVYDEKGNDWIVENWPINSTQFLDAYQYLIGESYLVHPEAETLVEWGWVKVKEVNNG